MKAISTSDDQHIEALVRRHQGAVRGFLLYMGAPPRLVDDLVQEVFLSFLSARFEERGEAATAAYLRGIARNLFLKAMQRERRQPVFDDLDAAERAWVEFQGEDAGEGYLVALRECLRQIRGKASDVLRLRYRQSLRRADIAERMGLTEAGIKSILVRTRKRLRDCVERRMAW